MVPPGGPLAAGSPPAGAYGSRLLARTGAACWRVREPPRHPRSIPVPN